MFSLKIQEIKRFEKYENEFHKKMLKLNQKLEMKKRKLEKVDVDFTVNQLKNNKVFDEDEVGLVEKYKEFGGCFSKVVGYLIVY